MITACSLLHQRQRCERLVAHARRQRVRARPRLTPEPTMRMNRSLLLGCLVTLSACAAQPVRGESPPPQVAKSADVTAIEGILESVRTAIIAKNGQALE